MLIPVRTMILALVCGALSVACANHPKVSTPAAGVQAAPIETVATSRVTASDADMTGTLPALPKTGPLSQTRILFDFDSSEIKPEYRAMLAAHGKLIAEDRTLRARLEGNTDERGSPEYNVALGERRAQAVKRALLLLGASDQQLGTVTYGAERPAVEGHSEAAWAQNRRVDLVYLPRL